ATDQISKKFSANVASVRNTLSSLNRHGNTFQGMITSSPATRPGAIKNIHSTAAQQITAAETSLYNPLNRHDNTDSHNPTFSDELDTFAGSELDEYLFESYPLFSDNPKDSPNESSPYTEEIKISNKPFNQFNYTLNYIQQDDEVS
ncbi:hypothetical protein, partial [Aeromonas salmonicida]|uniref:hypothetical protein n=1 Tax=Aeromonas salmonicida TaxID=645 RepID=UPI00309AB5C8